MRARSVLLAAAACIALAACRAPEPPPGGRLVELERIDERVGTGALAAPGSELTVHYTGWLYDGREPDRRGAQFDSSRTRGEPLTFLLGAGRVIRGWVDGVLSYQKTNMIWRLPGHQNLHVRTVWLNVHAGGEFVGLCETSHVYLDQMVVATDAPIGKIAGR